jgi:gluconokinase
MAATCSALKRKYRDVLREASKGSEDSLIRFIFLSAPEEVLRERARTRHGHFAGENLVHSQFETLEFPGQDEVDVITVDANREMGDLERDVISKVQSVMCEKVDQKQQHIMCHRLTQENEGMCSRCRKTEALQKIGLT